MKILALTNGKNKGIDPLSSEGKQLILPVSTLNQISLDNIRNLPHELVVLQREFQIIDGGGLKVFCFDEDDDDSEDNAATIIRTLEGDCLKLRRHNSEGVSAEFFQIASTNTAFLNTARLEACISYCIQNRIRNIYFAEGIFHFAKFTTNTEISLIGLDNKTIFDFSGEIGECVTLEQGISSSYNVQRKPVPLKSIKFTGGGNLNLPYSVLSAGIIPQSGYGNNTCLKIKCPNFTVSRCEFHGFGQTTKFESDSYLITFSQCTFSFNNYGFVFNRTGYTNSGERILLNDCTVANNNTGIYNKGGMIFCNNISIDYNYIRHIENYHLPESGLKNSSIIITSFHMEQAKNNMILNEAILNFDSGVMWNEYYTDDELIDNQGVLNIKNVFLRYYSKRYLIKGNAPETFEVSYLSDSQVQKASRYDNLFRLSLSNQSLTGGFSVKGGLTFDTAVTYNNTSSIKLTSWLYGQGNLTSPKIKPLKEALFIQYLVNGKDEVAGTQYATVTFFDKFDKIISSTILSTTIAGDVWVFAKSGWLGVPQHCAYLTLTINTITSGNSPAKSIYLDDLVLTWRGKSIIAQNEKSEFGSAILANGQVTVTNPNITINSLMSVTIKTMTGNVPAYFEQVASDGQVVIYAKKTDKSIETLCTAEIIYNILKY